MNIVFDIETIPCQWPGILAEFAADVKAPATHKKPETIAAWLAENRESEAESAWLKTSFDGGMGQIVCLSWALDEGDATVLSVLDLSASSEAALLGAWFSYLGNLHNGTSGGGTYKTDPIKARTEFMLTCTNKKDEEVSASVVVGVLPQYIEI